MRVEWVVWVRFSGSIWFVINLEKFSHVGIRNPQNLLNPQWLHLVRSRTILFGGCGTALFEMMGLADNPDPVVPSSFSFREIEVPFGAGPVCPIGH
jgi:hypothetical protein